MSRAFALPNSCRHGLCHSCLLVSDDPIPEAAQHGLTAHQRADGLFMSCLCLPTGDMTVSLPGACGKERATLIAKRWLNSSVIELAFETGLRWIPGQYTTLWKDETQGRAYSICSSRKYDGLLKLHVKHYAQGVVSSWVADELQEGDELWLGEAAGHCMYTEDAHDKPLLLVGTGTGLSPLYGILLDALRQGHTQPIHLYIGAGDEHQLYFVDELQALVEAHENVQYRPVIQRGSMSAEALKGELGQQVLGMHSALRGWKVYLCGNPDMVQVIKKRCFLSGASSADILTDEFWGKQS